MFVKQDQVKIGKFDKSVDEAEVVIVKNNAAS